MSVPIRTVAAGLWLAAILSACSPAAEPVAPTVNPVEAATSTTTPPASPVPSATVTPTASATPSRTPEPTPTLPAGELFECLPEEGVRTSGIVAGVIDGDTILVQVRFQQFTVRYIGIDTPETSLEPPEFMAVEARARNRELVSGERVTLIGDPEEGETDIYNRLLRYVVVDDVFVNAVLVREGLARYYPGENGCGALFFEAEQQARSENIGIWSDSP